MILNLIKNSVKPLGGLFFFDFSRCRLWVAIWWLCCLVQAVVGVGLVVRGGEPLGGQYFGVSQTVAYVALLILVGLLFQASHPGLKKSFFRARPVGAAQVLVSRWSFVVVLLLLPHFLAQLAPLLWVDRSHGAVSAFAVYYWSAHLGVVAILSALATGSQKISSYLLRAFFGGAVLLAVAAMMKRFSWRESNWFYVASPEAARLLWETGLCALAVLGFVWITAKLYRGRTSWRLVVVGILTAVLLAAAWKPLAFWPDVSAMKSELPAGLVDMSQLSFEAVGKSRQVGYEIQRNESLGTYGTGGQTAPPYWNEGEEAFWFIRGNYEIKGLDPDLAYSARLLSARWISAEGEVVEYDPPAGTFAIRNLRHGISPPMVTTARLDALLGAPPTLPKYFVPHTGQTQVLLFGAWTSTYERFKTAPGRLELRVRVDFYRYEIEQRIPLGGAAASGVSNRFFRLVGVEQTGDGLEVKLNAFVPSKRWEVPIEQRWGHGTQNWLIYNSKTKQRGPSMGLSSGGSSPWQSIYDRRLGIQFRADMVHWDYPDLSRPKALELLYIQPQYLGSTEVDVVIEDFSLVTEQSIEWAER